jgi:hypothetical protein
MGKAYTVGAYLDEPAQGALMDYVLQMAGIQGMKTEQDVEVCERLSVSGDAILMVINHAPSRRSFNLPWPAHEHLTGQVVRSELELLPYGVAILTKAE